MLLSRSIDAFADFRASRARLRAAMHKSCSFPCKVSNEALFAKMEYSRELSEAFCKLNMTSSSGSIATP